MVRRDSLGVPQEPEEPRLEYYDEYHNPVYEGHQRWMNSEGKIITTASFEEYATDCVDELSFDEAWEMLNDLIKNDRTEEDLRQELYEEIMNQGILSTLDLEEVEG